MVGTRLLLTGFGWCSWTSAIKRRTSWIWNMRRGGSRRPAFCLRHLAGLERRDLAHDPLAHARVERPPGCELGVGTRQLPPRARRAEPHPQPPEAEQPFSRPIAARDVDRDDPRVGPD